MHKRLTLLFGLILSANFNLWGQTYQQVSGDTSGYTPGEFSVTDGGAASYRVGIQVSPGTTGMQPKLAFGYSSQGGNGLLGMGWSLEGFSVISRAAQTVAQDGQVKAVNFTATDRFALDGERIVQVDPGAQYGANGTEYRTEQNAFYKIVSYGTTATPTHFVAYTKSGLTIEFGNAADAKVTVSGGVIVHWLVNKISDRRGNYYTFSYSQNPQTGDYKPLEVNYTGNSNTGILPYASVKFEYESRSDSMERYVSGVRLSGNTSRLKAIKYYYGAVVVRSYTFNYQYSPSGVSQLISFQEGGRNGSKHTPTTFTWSNAGIPSFGIAPQTNIIQGATLNQLVATDLNADGVMDILKVVKGGNAEAYVSNKSVSGLALPLTPLNPGITVSGTGKVVLADFNGDGKADVLVYDSLTGANSIRLNTTMVGDAQIGFFIVFTPIPPTYLAGAKAIVAADHNGDGRTDLLSIDWATGNNYWFFSTSVGNTLGFLPNGASTCFTNLVPTGLFTGSYQPYFSDFDGDGLSEILFHNPANGTNHIYRNFGGTAAYQLIASTVVPVAQVAASGGRFMINDVNSDGLADLLYYVPATGVNLWWTNKGNFTFASQTPNAIGSQIAGGDNLLQLDFNSDGYLDLVWFKKSTGENRWFANNGRLLFTQTNSLIPLAELTGYDVQGIGNFTSKTGFDLYVYNNSATIKSKIFKGSTVSDGIVASITCGNGLITDISYDYLTSDSLYTKTDSALYPLMDYQATQRVVKGYQVDNGVGGKSKVSFHYSGARILLNGRGFRGFAEVRETDEATGIVKVRTYLSGEESWKYISSPLIRNITRLANGTVISRTDIQNGLKVFYGGKCHFSYVLSSSSKTYELDGTYVDSTRTEQQYDDYGNVASTVTYYGDSRRDSLVNLTYNDAVTWTLGRLVTSRLYRFDGAQTALVRASAFEYDPATGAMTKETVEPDSSNTIKIIKTYVRDVCGNITQSKVTAWNGSAQEHRVTTSAYDAQKRFALSVTNAMGHTATQTFDPYLGNVLTTTDANGHVTQKLYDNFGRLIKTINPDGTWISIDYRKCGGAQSCPAYAKHLIYQQSSNGPPIITYYDLFNREVRTQKKGFNGTLIYQDRSYNQLGQLSQETLPYFSNESPVFTNYYYDASGRQSKIVSPGNRVDSVSYNGRTTSYFNALGQKKVIIKDSKERIITSRDHQGNEVHYEYDPASHLIKIISPNGSQIKMFYDAHGNMRKLDDPDLGVREYVTNGFGELMTVIRGAQITTSEYDSLGRIIKRVEPEGTLKYYYDGQPYGVGLMDSVVGYNFYKEGYTYDAQSRVSAQTKRIDSAVYTQSITYDNVGRVLTTIDPTGFSLTNVYNANGYLNQVKNTNSNVIYWTATTMNARDQVLQQQYGNGTQVNKAYDVNTSYLTSINTKKNAVLLQHLSFVFDDIGNLRQRRDSLQNKQEDFWLDNLNRLTKSKVVGGDSVLLTYNAIGNILSKSDVGTYTYGSPASGPHQVQSIAITTTQCIPSLLISTQPNSFDKIREITKDSFTVKIFYGPDHQRNAQKMYVNGVLTRRKIYVSAAFEKEIRGGDTIITHYVPTPEGMIAAFTTHSLTGQSATLHYFHKDHLGSTVMVTDDTGVIARYSMDAWGKRRNADWSSILTDTTKLPGDRGFTGHEHYDLFELVDMNGRCYDPTIGRFTSADPFIQDVTNLQSLNRYSYCLNNPLSYTDPSGYLFGKLGKLFSKAVKAVGHAVSKAGEWVGDNWRSLVTTAVAITVGYFTMGTGFWAVVSSGAASGFAAGATSTLLSGGNLGDALKAGIRGAVVGGITAGATYGVAELFPAANSVNTHATNSSNVMQKMLGHGVVQGGANVANGGKFIHGFYAGAASTAGGLLKQGINDPTSRIAASAIIGGTASELTGGDFANGAVTGAFIQMYNDQQGEGHGRSAALKYLGKFEPGTTGYVLRPLVWSLNFLGNYYTLGINGDIWSGNVGDFFKSNERLLYMPPTEPVLRELAMREYNFFSHQEGMTRHLGTMFSPEVRYHIMNSRAQYVNFRANTTDCE